jgi:hypothetical protein
MDLLSVMAKISLGGSLGLRRWMQVAATATHKNGFTR